MRLRRLSVRCEYKFYEQAVLFDNSQLMTILADDVTVARQFPGGISLLHQMTAAAKARILLYIGIIPYRQYNTYYAYYQQDRNEDGLFTRTQSAIKLFKDAFKEFDHSNEAPMMQDVWNTVLCDNELRYLNGIQRSTFSDIIYHDPKVQTVLNGSIFTDPPYPCFVLTGHIQLERIYAS